jgi:hypothetical protein
MYSACSLLEVQENIRSSGICLITANFEQSDSALYSFQVSSALIEIWEYF